MLKVILGNCRQSTLRIVLQASSRMSSGGSHTTLVTPTWLASQLKSPTSNVRPLDCSWYLPSTARDSRLEYLKEHIPRARFFDIDACCDTEDPLGLDHMLPAPQCFEEYIGKHGISNDSHVVVYDTNEQFGLFSAQRVWWTFKVMGHHLVSILDGGFTRWKAEENEVSSGEKEVTPQKFRAQPRPQMVKSYDNVVDNIEKKQFQLVDARSAGRFKGEAPEPREGMKPGHMPGAVSIPFSSIMDPETHCVKSRADLEKVFEDAGVSLDKPTIASCGSGVTACHLVLAAHLCGRDHWTVYDGAWVEWYLRAPDHLKADVPRD